MAQPHYRGRIAPTPTGYLHLGHARTFWFAQARAQVLGGENILRSDDLDNERCQAEFSTAMIEDLKWCGLSWNESPDIGGSNGPYEQSGRIESYRAAFLKLLTQGYLYPCYCSRKDIRNASRAPHQAEDEIIYPGTCRPEDRGQIPLEDWKQFRELNSDRNGRRPAWRFRAESQAVEFTDGYHGLKRYLGGIEFGDFVVWRQDDLPSYQLACAVDDFEMGITEVVRGADLMISTARQLLLLQALKAPAPSYFHCPLMLDESGNRLAKRIASLSLREMRAAGEHPGSWFRQWEEEFGETIRPGAGK
jgi:glutamyl-tRNA synthetase